MSKRAKSSGATQASVGAAFCALTGVTAAAATAASASPRIEKRWQSTHCSRKLLLALSRHGDRTANCPLMTQMGHGSITDSVSVFVVRERKESRFQELNEGS